MPAAVAIPAIVGAAGVGAQIYGAHKAASAATKAADIQSQAAQQVAEEARRTAGQAAEGVTAASRAAAEGVTGAATAAQSGVIDAAAQANALLSDYYGQAQGLLNPYNQAGQTALTQWGTELSAPAERFDFKFSEADPSYQWRLEQGQKALERSAALRGSVLSGATLKALTNYAQGAASQEYANEYERALKAFETNQRNRYARIGSLAQLAGLGANAASGLVSAGEFYGGRASENLTDAARLAGTFGLQGATTAGQFGVGGAEAAGQFGLRGAEIAGNAVTGGANARAAGTVGAANAWNQGIGGAINTGMNAFTLAQLMKGPQIMYGGGPQTVSPAALASGIPQMPANLLPPPPVNPWP